MDNRLEIIILCSGKSTRYPTKRPKYLLPMYDGQLMIEKIINSYIPLYNSEDFKQIKISLLVHEEHNKEYRVKEYLENKYNFYGIKVYITGDDLGPAHGVFELITSNKFDENSTLLIRDCDSLFTHKIEPNKNVTFVQSLKNIKLNNPENKSYVKNYDWNGEKFVCDIIEKEIISDVFNVGGYQFSTIAEYIKLYNYRNKDCKFEYNISNILNSSITKIKIEFVEDYIDLGTYKEYIEFNDKPTLFVDIDGCVVYNQSRLDKTPFENYKPLQKNVDKLLEMQYNGSKLIFTTARSSMFEDKTTKMLDNLGFQNYTLIMDLSRSRRILINDFDQEYPMAEAINLQTEQDDLNKYLK